MTNVHDTLELARAAAEAAQIDHAARAGDHAAADEAYTAAAEAFDTDPHDKAGREVTKAREARDLAGVRLAAAEKRLDAARRAEDAAAAAVTEHQRIEDAAAARAYMEAAEGTHRGAVTLAAELARTANGSTVGAKIAAAVAALAHRERAAAKDATVAEELAHRERAALEQARDRLAVVDPIFAAELPTLRAREAEQDTAARVERLAHVGSVPGLVVALEPAVALRRAAAELVALAGPLELGAARDLDGAREALALGPLPFDSEAPTKALVRAILRAELDPAPRDVHFAQGTLRGLFGTLPSVGMDPREEWTRILAGETPGSLLALSRERGNRQGAIDFSRRTDASADPIVKARAAAMELRHGRQTGSWVRDGREEHLVATLAAAVPIADEFTKRPGVGPYRPEAGPEIHFSRDVTLPHQIADLLMLSIAGVTLAELKALVPAPAPEPAPAAAAAA